MKQRRAQGRDTDGYAALGSLGKNFFKNIKSYTNPGFFRKIRPKYAYYARVCPAESSGTPNTGLALKVILV